MIIIVITFLCIKPHVTDADKKLVLLTYIRIHIWQYWNVSGFKEEHGGGLCVCVCVCHPGYCMV